jgi:hypothetical protein
MARNVDIAMTDSSADWLVVSAASVGLDPWDDVLVLANEFETEFAPIGGDELGDIHRVHPRTPGALLLMKPMAGVSVDDTYKATLVITSFAFLMTAVAILPRLANLNRRTVILSFIGLVASASFLSTLEFGTHSGLLMLSVCGFWLAAKSGNDKLAGFALGIAGVLRVFPLLLLIPLWRAGRREAVAWSIGTFILLNVIGLLVFDLDAVDAIRALTEAGSAWIGFSGNGSLAMPLARLGVPSLVIGIVLTLGAAVAAWLISHPRRDLDIVLGAVLVIALLTSPLSWEHYDLLALPVVAIFATRGTSRFKAPIVWACLGWVGLQVIANPLDALIGSPTFSLAGTLALVGRLLLLAAAALFIKQQTVERPVGAHAA